MDYYFANYVYENTFSIFLALFCFISLYYAFKKLKKIRLLQDTPASKIRAAAQGYLQLEGVGKHMPGPPIKAPRSGLDCLWFEYKVERIESQDGIPVTTTVSQQISDDCFYIDDNTGLSVVNPDKAFVIPSRKSVTYERLPGRANAKLKHTEITIDVGTPIMVIGEFKTIRQSDHDLSIDDEIGVLIRSWKKDYHELLEQYDEDGNGELDPNEWEKVLYDAEQEVLANRREEKHTTGVHVMAYPTIRKRLPYIISGKSVQELLRVYRFRCFGLFFIASITGYYPCMHMLRAII